MSTSTGGPSRDSSADANGRFDAASILAMRPMDLHKSSKETSVDIQDIIDKSPCVIEYTALEECLGEHSRNWKMCQPNVRTLSML